MMLINIPNIVLECYTLVKFNWNAIAITDKSQVK